MKESAERAARDYIEAGNQGAYETAKKHGVSMTDFWAAYKIVIKEYRFIKEYRL